MDPEETTPTQEGTVAETPASSHSAEATRDKPDSLEATQENSDSATPFAQGYGGPKEATPDNQTAQMGGNEPIGENQSQDPASPADIPASPASTTQNIPAVTPEVEKSKIRELFEKARFTIQLRKRKKMDKIIELFGSTNSLKLTNDDVEKLLHVSDSTAERYLNILEKEGKIRQVGRGRGAYYVLNI